MSLELGTALPSSVKTDRPVKVYRAGSLTYDTRGLAVLFAWLLWGDFAFCFFENIFGKFIPLYLKELHAPDSLVGVMAGSIAGGVNLLFLPGLSRWSDDLRGPWGRRVPFLVAATPLTVLTLVLMGFAPEIASALHGTMLRAVAPSVSLTVFTLGLMAVFVTAFHGFNMVLCNAFTWLVRDVVPLEVVARFLSWFRIVSTVSAVLFNWYVFPHLLSHRQAVCVNIGLFYLVTFLLMCRFVREGEYPAPEQPAHAPGWLRSFVRYFRLCLAVPIYRHYFYAMALAGIGACAGPFVLIFTRDTLGIGMDDLGKIFAVGTVVTAVSYPPMSWLCERVSPMRLILLAQAGSLVLALLSFVFIHDKPSLLTLTVVSSAVSVGWGLGNAVLAMRLFPTKMFGQFSGAVNIFGVGVGIVGNYGVGLFMELVYGNYRMAYFWQALSGLSLLPLLLVYRDWKRFGGPGNYIAPIPAVDSGGHTVNTGSA